MSIAKEHGIHDELFDDVLPALRLANPPRSARKLAVALTFIMASTPVLLAVVPWTQTVEGSGSVVAFNPLERKYQVEAPVAGRIVNWHGIREGKKVKAGDIIVTIEDNDPDYLNRLKLQKDAIEAKIESAKFIVTAYEKALAQVKLTAQRDIAEATQQLDVARQKVVSDERGLDSAKFDLQADLLQYERFKKLYPQGLISLREMELAEAKYATSNQKVGQAEAYLAASKADLEAKQEKLGSITAKSEAEIQKAEAQLNDGKLKVQTETKELQDLITKIERWQRREVKATHAGTIVRVLAYQGSVMVKEGDPIALILPEVETQSDLAVELYMDGNDIPLIDVGDHVRIQFEGWPALQFAAWPQVARGTFGGTVKMIDPIETGKGSFRILVVPDDKDDWPAQHLLRQGALAKGWVLLREVPLGFELWRRLNGFPPGLGAERKPDGGEDKEKVKVKRPK
jgi:multidrug resistance efflux pump